MASDGPTLVKVKTTLPSKPFPTNAARAPIRTERLIIRPLTQNDLPNTRSLRTQPEVMQFTAAGRTDGDLSETQAKLDPFLPPRDVETYNPGIYLASTGEFVGLGGVFKTTSMLGWPEVGYMLKREHWGQGYGAEFLRAFAAIWWSLPRFEVETDVDGLSVKPSVEGERVPEMLCAIVASNNPASLRVLEKAGFQKFREWKEADSRAEGGYVTLNGFALSSEGRQLLQ